MKLKVIFIDGSVETLDLTHPVVSSRCQIISGDGTVHFFLEDGTYDGWERPIIMHDSEVEPLLEAARQHEQPPKDRVN